MNEKKRRAGAGAAGKRKTLYFCDPEKNMACRKNACIYNPRSKWRQCDATTKKEFARLELDGQPCEIPEWVMKQRRGVT